MKKIYSLSLIALAVGGLFSVTGCEKNIVDKTPVTPTDNSTFAQVYVATISGTNHFVAVDGNTVNGAALSYGSIFPAVGLYAFAVSPGLKAFTVSGATPITFSENLQINNNYTVFLYDTVTSPRQKTVLTKIEHPTDGTARLRFANFVYSTVGVPAVDIYSKRQAINIFTNVPVTDVTQFISYPAGVVDTFLVRPTGTTTQLQNGTADVQAILTPLAGRSYTLIFRGSYRTTTPSTAANIRTLSTFINY